MTQRVRKRTDRQNALVCQLFDEIKTNAIADIDEAVELYKIIDSDQRRWIAQHDWLIGAIMRMASKQILSEQIP